jgi:serpin B
MKKILLATVISAFTNAVMAQTPCSSPVFGKASNQFSFDLYRQLAKQDGALFFSPFSIHSILDLTAEGARNQTLTGMQQVLHTDGIRSCIRTDSKRNLQRFNTGDVAGDSIYTANAIWLQKELILTSAFSGIATNYYAAGTRTADFKKDGEGSRKIINGWVEQQTRNRIKELIPVNVINPATRMVLVNAVWFKGGWANPFNKNRTKPDNFFSGTDSATTPFMNDVLHINYMEDETAQLVELPYKSAKRSMLVLLPAKGKENEFENSFTYPGFEQRMAALTRQKVNISLPRFKLESKFDLSSTLKNMGMESAFSDSADFSGISAETSLKISNVLHKAFIEVDENGTEAAAATAVLMVLTTSAHPNPVPVKTFKANRPFIFILRDNETGIILFMGKMSRP